MKKPVIGIVGSFLTDKRDKFIGVSLDYNNNNYSKCIVKALGIPIYLPVIKDLSIIDDQLNICDGLLFPGGYDINPICYNQSPLPLQGESNSLVDWYQITLAKKSLKTNKPILGICRGMQLLNVASSGTLFQDICYGIQSPLQHNQNSYLGEKCHPICIYDDSILKNTLGNHYVVNSGHHQCLDKIGDNFKVTAVAPDGVIESIEMINKDFVIGVQWHPEMLSLNDDIMLGLFKKFIDTSRILI